MHGPLNIYKNSNYSFMMSIVLLFISSAFIFLINYFFETNISQMYAVGIVCVHLILILIFAKDL